jgi:hypothetical protein
MRVRMAISITIDVIIKNVRNIVKFDELEEMIKKLKELDPEERGLYVIEIFADDTCFLLKPESRYEDEIVIDECSIFNHSKDIK